MRAREIGGARFLIRAESQDGRRIPMAISGTVGEGRLLPSRWGGKSEAKTKGNHEKDEDIARYPHSGPMGTIWIVIVKCLILISFNSCAITQFPNRYKATIR